MIFKLAFTFLFLGAIWTVVGVVRRLKAAGRATSPPLAHEIAVLKAIRPLLGVIFYGGVIWWMIDESSLPFGVELPLAVRFVGIAFGLIGLWLFDRAARELGSYFSSGVHLYDDHRLVTTGPYRWVRHPIYLAFVVIMVGVLLMSANLLIGLSGLLLVLLIPPLRINQEERLLADRFGASYRDYQARVACIVPGIRRTS